MATRALSLLMVLGLLAGCQEAQDRVDAARSQATDVVKAKTDAAIDRVAQEAQGITDRTSAAALASVRQGLVEAQAALANLKAPTELEKLRLDWITDQIAQIDAAQRVQDLRSQVDAKVAAAKELEANARKSTEQIRQELLRADETYRNLTQSLTDAQKAYEDVTARVQSAANLLGGG